MGKAILVNQKDNVVTAVSDIKKGEEIVYPGSGANPIKAREEIPYGHKTAISKISQGGDIIKYGEVVGRAGKDIEPGDWVHSHNTQETYVPSR